MIRIRRLPTIVKWLILSFFVLAVVVGYFVQFTLVIDNVPSSLNYSFVNSTFINSTIVGNSSQSSGTALFHISSQTIPTIINGITTATSIIIGFSATLVGIIAREILNKEEDKEARNFMIGTVLFIFPVIVLLFFLAYVFMLFGGFWLHWALTYAFVNLLFAILALIAIFIFIDMHNKAEKKRKGLASSESKEPPPNESEKSPPNNQTETEKNHQIGDPKISESPSKDEIREKIETEKDLIKKASLDILELETDPKNAIKIKQKIMEIQSSLNIMASYSEPIRYRLDGFTDMANALLGMLSISPTEEERKRYEALIQKPPKELSKIIGMKVNRRLGVHHNASYPVWWSIVITPLDTYCCYANSIAFDLNDNVWRLRNPFKRKVSFDSLVKFNIGLINQ